MKNLHNIFKKAAGSASNVFKKASDVGENVFKKVSNVAEAVKDQAPGVAQQISEGAGQAQNVLNKVSKISGKIAAHPVTQSLPFGSAIAGAAGAISGASRLGAQGAGQLSQAANLKNYKSGGVNAQLQNISDVQKRGKEIAESGRQAARIFV